MKEKSKKQIQIYWLMFRSLMFLVNVAAIIGFACIVAGIGDYFSAPSDATSGRGIFLFGCVIVIPKLIIWILRINEEKFLTHTKKYAGKTELEEIKESVRKNVQKKKCATCTRDCTYKSHDRR